MFRGDGTHGQCLYVVSGLAQRRRKRRVCRKCLCEKHSQLKLHHMLDPRRDPCASGDNPPNRFEATRIIAQCFGCVKRRCAVLRKPLSRFIWHRIQHSQHGCHEAQAGRGRRGPLCRRCRHRAFRQVGEQCLDRARTETARQSKQVDNVTQFLFGLMNPRKAFHLNLVAQTRIRSACFLHRCFHAFTLGAQRI